MADSRKIAVFGKPGGGKSTLGRAIAKRLELPYVSLDALEYRQDGSRRSLDLVTARHKQLLEEDAWVLDGFITKSSLFERLEKADVLIYVDLPYHIHYRWVIKRFLMSPVRGPEGWPEGCSVWKGTVASLKTLRLCPRFWNEELVTEVRDRFSGKKLLIIDRVEELKWAAELRWL